MKAVALLVLYVGYGLVAYGIDHIQGNCTPFGCVFLGQFAGSNCGSGSVPCNGAGPSSASGVPIGKSTAALTGKIHNPAGGGLGSTGSTVIRQSSLPGAGSTGAPGL